MKDDTNPSRGRRLLLTIAQLAGLGVAGTATLGLLVTLLALGVATVPAFGLGLLLLAALVYALYAVAWFEVERVSRLFDLGLPPLEPAAPPRRKGQPVKQQAQSLWRQARDGRMWRALANFIVATASGLLILWLAQALAWSAIAAATPLTDVDSIQVPLLGRVDDDLAFLLGVLGIGVCAAAIAGLAMLQSFFAHVILADPSRRVLTEQVQAKTEQRQGAVRAAELERTRIERDLHDGVQPRLVSVGMTLGLAQQKIDSDPARARELIAEAHTSTKAAITELRQLARGIHASVLDDRGLDAALSALAGRSHIPVTLDVRMEGRPTVSEGTFREAEAAAYFSIAEALTNAAKHSRASSCRVAVRLREPGTPRAVLWARVEDNGIGGANVSPGGGLDGIFNRVLAAGGIFRFDSPLGGPTALEVSVPCGS